jgi:hypothetical protein
MPVLHCKFLSKLSSYLKEQLVVVYLSYRFFPILKAKRRKNYGKKTAEDCEYSCSGFIHTQKDTDS